MLIRNYWAINMINRALLHLKVMRRLIITSWKLAKEKSTTCIRSINFSLYGGSFLFLLCLSRRLSNRLFIMSRWVCKVRQEVIMIFFRCELLLMIWLRGNGLYPFSFFIFSYLLDIIFLNFIVIITIHSILMFIILNRLVLLLIF